MEAIKAPKKFLSRIEEAYQAGTSVVDYELPTKIGYWDEKLALRNEKLALITKKRARCETLTIRKNALFENLHKPCRIQEPNPYIHYGDPIQISTDELQTTALGVKASVLAAIVTERDIDVTVNLCHGCPIVASGYKQPCVKNIFNVVDTKSDKKGERISYGNDVYLTIGNSAPDRTLYIQALVSTFDDFGGANEHYPLRLCECPDRYCKFKFLHYNPSLRDVTRGDSVPSNTRLCIAHTVTNRFLVTEKNYMPTLFGNEMQVSCYIYKNNGIETPENCWELSIQKQKTVKKRIKRK